MNIWFLFLSLAYAQLELNTATADQLASIEGVDGALAQRIVSLRDKRGHLSNVEALRTLSITESTLDQIRGSVVVDLQVSTKSDRSFTSANEVLAHFSYEPDIRSVQSMAMTYSKTNPALIQKWMGAVRRAYILPKLNLQYEKELDQYTRFDYISDEEGDPSSEKDYAQVDNDDKIVVKLEWRLDKLVMSSEQIRIINESQKTVKLREKLLDEVTRLYFDRRRLQVEQLLNPPSGLQARIEGQLRLQVAKQQMLARSYHTSPSGESLRSKFGPLFAAKQSFLG